MLSLVADAILFIAYLEMAVSMGYTEVIFGGESSDVLYEFEMLLEKRGADEAVAYLANWDYGTETDDMYSILHNGFTDEIERRRSDLEYEYQGYTCIHRRGIYVSLWRKAFS